jgi:hypothetical protein
MGSFSASIQCAPSEELLVIRDNNNRRTAPEIAQLGPNPSPSRIESLLT